MNMSCLFFGILFTVAGILFAAGKLHSRLSSWKTLSDKDKASMNVRLLCQNVGFMITLCGLIFLISGICPVFKEKCFSWAMIAWIIMSGLDVYHMEKSPRYIRHNL